MFRTSIGPVDLLDDIAKALANKALPAAEIRKLLDEANKRTAVCMHISILDLLFDFVRRFDLKIVRKTRECSSVRCERKP